MATDNDDEATPLSASAFDGWLDGRRRARDGQRLGQAFLNSPLAATMRAAGRVDPRLFYEADDAKAEADVRERYVGRAPLEQGFEADVGAPSPR